MSILKELCVCDSSTHNGITGTKNDQKVWKVIHKKKSLETTNNHKGKKRQKIILKK